MGRRAGVTWAVRALLVPAVLVVGLSACGGGDDTADQASDRPAPGATSGATSGTAIGEPAPGTPAGEFLSTTVVDGGRPKKLVPGTHISLFFGQGTIRADAGCNTMSGDARFENGRLVVGDLAQTEMGCPGDGRHEQDTWVATFLAAGPAYTYDGTTLDLRTSTAEIVLKPKEQVVPDLPLEGTRWDVTHVISGPAAGNDDPNAAVSAGMAPSKAWLQFGDGKLTGNDGCNQLTGTATVTDDTVSFGDLASTKMACPGVDTRGVRAVLQGTVTWKITTAVLTLTHPSGAGLQLQAHRNASDLPATAPSDPGTGSVSPPCCKPLVGEDGASGASGSGGGSTGTGTASPTEVTNGPTQVNPAGPADAPPGS
jgi:heat shock protein HslJ